MPSLEAGHNERFFMFDRIKLVYKYLKQQYKIMINLIKIKQRLNKIYTAQAVNLPPKEYLKLEIERIHLEYDLLQIEKKFKDNKC